MNRSPHFRSIDIRCSLHQNRQLIARRVRRPQDGTDITRILQPVEHDKIASRQVDKVFFARGFLRDDGQDALAGNRLRQLVEYSGIHQEGSIRDLRRKAFLTALPQQDSFDTRMVFDSLGEQIFALDQIQTVSLFDCPLI